MLKLLKNLLDLLLPADLPENLEFLRIIVYILGFIFVVEVLLTPFYMIVTFYKNRRFS